MVACQLMMMFVLDIIQPVECQRMLQKCMKLSLRIVGGGFMLSVILLDCLMAYVSKFYWINRTWGDSLPSFNVMIAERQSEVILQVLCRKLRLETTQNFFLELLLVMKLGFTGMTPKQNNPNGSLPVRCDQRKLIRWEAPLSRCRPVSSTLRELFIMNLFQLVRL